jgi:hypothetical protein
MRNNRTCTMAALAAATSFVVLLMAACTTPGTGGPATAKWSSSDQWAEYRDGGYILRNDIWGSGRGPQTIWANSYSNWGVVADHPNTGGVKAYPHAAKPVNKNLSAIASLTSSFNVTVPASGAYATTYDIWGNNNAYEVMIWMNQTGPVGPISSGAPVMATVGGHSWAVHRGSNGANAVFSFIRQGNTASATVNLKQVLDWLRTQGWWGDVSISEVQFGYEITSSAGNQAFTTNSYSVTGG